MEPLLLMAVLTMAWLASLLAAIWVVPALVIAALARSVDEPADAA